MFQASHESLQDGRVGRYVISSSGSRLSYTEVLELWHSSEGFRSFFRSLLTDSPYSAFRWETPSITASTTDRPFEFVLVDSPGLDRAAERDAFAEHFPAGASSDVVRFDNLRGDAGLVVPCPLVDDAAYVHLASFVRHAPETQQHAFWKAVAQAMQERLSERPVWLSTAGGGVAWLHVRLDSRPKYYSYRPYQSVPE